MNSITLNFAWTHFSGGYKQCGILIAVGVLSRSTSIALAPIYREQVRAGLRGLTYAAN